MHKPRIGRIHYLNLYPVFFGLERTGFDCQYLCGVPSEVNNMLRLGQVDVSPSSSIEYLRRQGDYELVGGHSISSRGPVKSILLISKKPIAGLGGAEIGVTWQTETSAVLLNVILRKFYGLEYTAKEEKGGAAGQALEKYDAYLSIGDEALAIAGSQAASNRNVYDLGEIWFQKTGLPFVFALWIARKGWVGRDKKGFEGFKAALDKARDYGLSKLQEAVAVLSVQNSELCKKIGPEEIIHYWETIFYGLTGAEKEGLELFRRYALELGAV